MTALALFALVLLVAGIYALAEAIGRRNDHDK